MPEFILVICSHCGRKNRVRLRWLERGRCGACKRPLGSFAKPVTVECPDCHQHVPCSLSDPAPRCQSCNSLLRESLQSCAKCGLQISRVELKRLALDPEPTSVTLGLVCPVCYHSWQFFRTEGLRVGTPQYMEPASRMLDADEVDMQHRRDDGWPDWIALKSSRQTDQQGMTRE